jgi:Lon protease-like protein
VPRLLPLFPLNVVLVPGLVLPLHIFEPRYRQLVEELLALPDEEDREFGVIAVREGRTVEQDGPAALFDVGTTVILRQAERLPDGRFDIMTTGNRRFSLLSLDASAPLLRADVEFLEDDLGPLDPETIRRVGSLFLDYRQALVGQVPEDAPRDTGALPDDPTTLSYLVTAAMVLPPLERQELLAAATTTDRLRRAEGLLRRETALLSVLGAVPTLEIPGPTPSVN